MSEFHSNSRKGVICIPAGLEQQGWAQFSLFCKGHQNHAPPTQRQTTNERRREVARAAGTNKASEGGKPQIMHQDFLFENHVTESENKAMGLISVDMPKDMVNSRVQLNLKLDLGCGPDGTWVISRAELIKPEPIRTQLTKPPNGPTTRPVSHQVWRPKIQPIKRTHPISQKNISSEASTQAESSNSKPSTSEMPPIPLSPNPFHALSSEWGVESTETPEAQLSSLVQGQSSRELESSKALTLVSTHSNDTETKVTVSSACETTLAGFGDEVTRTWGSSSDWVLELRDGKRISIPMSLIRQPSMVEPCIPESTEEPKVLLLEGFDDMGSSEGQFESEEDDDEEEDVSVVWEDPELPKERGMVVCCEENDRPLEIEPLAALIPTSSHLPELRSDEVRDTIPPSEWVWGKYKEFGEYLGASYEGYEDEVLQLLKAIDARRPQQPSDKAKNSNKTKTGGRGSRELKRLMTLVNYDTGSARKRVDPRERGLAITQ